MTGGVYAIARQIWDNPDFANEPFTEREAWMWLVGAAAYQDLKSRGARGPLKLRRGEFCFAVRFLAAKWQWSKSRVDRFINALENRDSIKDASRDGEKVYSIRNYNRFQTVALPRGDNDGGSVGTPSGHDRDSSGTRAGHERDKEELSKSLNQEIPSSLRSDGARARAKHGLPDDFPSRDAFEKARAYWLSKHRTDLNTGDEAAKFRDHHTSHGSKMVNWDSAWGTWFRNAVSFNKPERANGNGRISAHDKGTHAARDVIAELELEIIERDTGVAPSGGGGARAIGHPLPANGHGRSQVERAVQDVLPGPITIPDRRYS